MNSNMQHLERQNYILDLSFAEGRNQLGNEEGFSKSNSDISNYLKK